MKKSLLSLACMLLLVAGYTQQLPQTSARMTDAELGQFYLQKSKSQKTIAWVLLVAGAALQVAGSVSYADNLFEESTSGADAMMIVGSLASIVSIPLFISAAKNKGRAEILLRHENIPMSFSPRKRMNIGIAIALGR